MAESTTIPVAPPVHPTDDAELAAVRRRWRASADRLWPSVLFDDEAYRRTAGAVGLLLERLREQTGTLDELRWVEHERADRLPGLDTAAATPDVLAAACALRAVEIDAQDAALHRRAVIGSARAAGAVWVTLSSTTTRVVEMHIGTGRAIAATADPYDPDGPYTVGEVALDPSSGVSIEGRNDAEARCASHDEWLAERAARRDGIEQGAAAGGGRAERETAGHDPLEGS